MCYLYRKKTKAKYLQIFPASSKDSKYRFFSQFPYLLVLSEEDVLDEVVNQGWSLNARHPGGVRECGVISYPVIKREGSF